MKKLEEITQAEFDAFKAHHSKYEYTQSEGNDLLNLVRMFINQHSPSCSSCTSNLRDAKTDANEWFLANKEKIESILSERNKSKNNEVNKTKK